ncbi:Multidrug resistance-associated protein [Blattamonas nauphoetae]|uniref:Multidrug resistance-associated protein n=1 Tax=Blattamonas nauphoetae TaxID=2049346 RepID=A0ABQ9X7G8_9EUKA|nr:Multidrug resistance-associated protein [Blattamonas nauphoetae]
MANSTDQMSKPIEKVSPMETISLSRSSNDSIKFSELSKEEFIRKPCLEEQHNCCFNLFFCFYFPFICHCKGLTDTDIYECHSEDKAETMSSIVKKNWDPQVTDYLKLKTEFDTAIAEGRQTTGKPPKPPSILRLIALDAAGYRVVIGVVTQMIYYGFLIVQPAMMQLVLRAIENRDRDPSVGFPYAPGIILILAPFLSFFFEALSIRMYFHYMVACRAMLIGKIFDKTLNLNISAQSNIDTGRMISLVSSDSMIIGNSIWQIFYTSLVPLQLIVPLILVIINFRVSAYVSIGVLLIFIPLSTFFMGLSGKAIHRYMTHGDARMKISNETFQGIRVVKFSGLESVFTDNIKQARAKQNTDSAWFVLWSHVSHSIVRNLSQAVNGATFTTFVHINGVDRSEFGSRVIPNFGYLNYSTNEANQFPYYFQTLTLIYYATQRIKQFLLLPEMKHEVRNPPKDANIVLQFNDASFKWPDPPEILKTEDEKEVIAKDEEAKLKDQNRREDKVPEEMQEMKETPPSSLHKPSTLSLLRHLTPTQMEAIQTSLLLRPHPTRLLPRSLTMVVGGVGSGKSSFGAAVIGEIEQVEGNVDVKGSIAFCPQTPWITNNTVRGNIVFGSSFDERKYLNTVRSCALVSDLKMLSSGDQTAIGEKGVNLSGGQKARIQLARAVYSDRDIYLLDDPLSAVDAHVGRYLMEECITGVLKGKTVILMTNQLQFLNRADNVILLNRGNVVAQGTYAQLKEKAINFDKYITKMDKDEPPNEATPALSPSPITQPTEITLADVETGADSAAGKQLLTEEEMGSGSINMSLYCSYLTSFFPIAVVPLFFVVCLLAESVPVFQTYWLSIIPSNTVFPAIDYKWKINMYSLLCVVGLVFFLVRACFLGAGTKRSTRIVHDRLLDHVIHCPPSFFDTTPMGRILNRFTGDLSQVDQNLLYFFMAVINYWIAMFGQLIIIGLQTPIFLAVGLPILLVLLVILVLYTKTARDIQRLDGIARSPVMTLYSESISGAGLVTIRAYHQQDVWRKRFFDAVDQWTCRSFLFSVGKNWSELYASMISTCFMAGVVVFGWNFMNSAQLGVCVMAAMTYSHLSTYLVHMTADLDAKMTSFERVRFYSTKLPQETKISSVTPPPEWPQKGQIQFDHVTFRYRPGLPFVLTDINLDIAGGEKLGVCGRTGAGKSSLLFALFRLVELDPALAPKMLDIDTGLPIKTDPTEAPNSGRVLIDGVDISKVELSRVRKAIAIIPQDPTLFAGTVRYNLDLVSKCTDDRIWEVLDMVEMHEVIAGLQYGLDSQVAEGGSNFSAGQRQLLCFGRAILNNCKIIVLDEATASVDVDSDAKIQRTIREHFVDKTLIVIAHRLNTILDSDRILVMEAGQVAEIDSPSTLKSNSSSALNALIHSLEH